MVLPRLVNSSQATELGTVNTKKELPANHETCRELGFETISMRDEFETIYKIGAVMIPFASGQAA